MAKNNFRGGFPGGMNQAAMMKQAQKMQQDLLKMQEDLEEIFLDTGKVNLYKWGAAASYLLGSDGAVKLGAVSPPPGLSVTEGREVRCGLTLRKGQALLLVSDGLEEEQVLEGCKSPSSPAALAERLLKEAPCEDDATIVTIQLIPVKS